MLPIIGFPSVVRKFAVFFRQVFSWNQFRRFKQDQSSLNRFLTLYEWDEEGLNRRRLELLQSMKEMKWRKEGVVALDDSLLQKTERKMPGAGKLWERDVWVHKVKLGRDIGYLLSSSRDLGPDMYKARWAIEVSSEMAKDLLPRIYLHT